MWDPSQIMIAGKGRERSGPSGFGCGELVESLPSQPAQSVCGGAGG